MREFMKSDMIAVDREKFMELQKTSNEQIVKQANDEQKWCRQEVENQKVLWKEKNEKSKMEGKWFEWQYPEYSNKNRTVRL